VPHHRLALSRLNPSRRPGHDNILEHTIIIIFNNPSATYQRLAIAIRSGIDFTTTFHYPLDVRHGVQGICTWDIIG
jgi:hypothetical protein